ncbi:Bacterial transferase [Bacillus thuringiensis serovar tochigiensis BGSC 4Y1]|nr:Bacterial transferase [Bacillus thuringiensis serovar tochigiensis BGSC 4Y1]
MTDKKGVYRAIWIIIKFFITFQKDTVLYTFHNEFSPETG